MSSEAKLLKTVIVIAVPTGAVVALVMGAQYGFESAVSAAAGCLIGVVNFWALVRLITILVGDVGGGHKGRAAVLLGGKAVGLLALVGVLVIKGWVRGGALMAGLSTVAISIVLAGLWTGGGSDSSTNGSIV